jgi:hypothetical protein
MSLRKKWINIHNGYASGNKYPLLIVRKKIKNLGRKK